MCSTISRARVGVYPATLFRLNARVLFVTLPVSRLTTNVTGFHHLQVPFSRGWAGIAS